MISSAHSVAKGLAPYTNLNRLAFQAKPIGLQMKEITGAQPFGKGLYHNSHYEDMMKALVDLRKEPNSRAVAT